MQGQADLEVGVELPAALMFTPRPFLEKAGNKLLKSVLVRIKQKLAAQLIEDYCSWAAKEVELEQTTNSQLSTDLGFQ